MGCICGTTYKCVDEAKRPTIKFAMTTSQHDHRTFPEQFLIIIVDNQMMSQNCRKTAQSPENVILKSTILVSANKINLTLFVDIPFIQRNDWTNPFTETAHSSVRVCIKLKSWIEYAARGRVGVDGQNPNRIKVQTRESYSQ